MRKFVFLAGALVCSVFLEDLQAQNKTLGVGAVTPNPNAALHVESPTGNQGFIMPRLTTVQRNAMAGILKATDNGLMLFDTDLNTIYIWNGSAWNSSAQVAGGPKLQYPYVDTVTKSPGANSNLLRLVYAGSATENVGIAHFENLNPNSGFSTIFGRTNSATNGVADFVVNNPNNNNDGISVVTNGIGTAARFTTNNKGAKTPTLWVQTNSDSVLSAPVYALNTGRGDVAGAFRINNTASPYPAIFAESNGTGRTATFNKLGTTGSQPAVFVNSQGGHGLWADHNGATGYAAIIQNINAANTNAAIFTEAVGSGPSLWTMKSTDAISGDAFLAENLIPSGSAGKFRMTSAENPQPALVATTDGTGAGIEASTATGWTAIYGRRDGAVTPGNAAVFEISDAGNNYPVVQINSNGAGGMGLNAQHNAATGDAIYAQHNGGGGGSAGNFRISNTANTASALFAATGTTNGTALGASNEANGVAIAIWSGGLRVTVADVNAASITTRAAAYRILSGGTVFTLDFGPGDGEIFMVYNETGAAITVGGVAINNGEGKTIVQFSGGVFRGL